MVEPLAVAQPPGPLLPDLRSMEAKLEQLRNMGFFDEAESRSTICHTIDKAWRSSLCHRDARGGSTQECECRVSRPRLAAGPPTQVVVTLGPVCWCRTPRALAVISVGLWTVTPSRTPILRVPACVKSHFGVHICERRRVY